MAIEERMRILRIIPCNDTKISWYDCRLPEQNVPMYFSTILKTGTRKPKAELTCSLAPALNVSPHPSMYPTLTVISG